MTARHDPATASCELTLFVSGASDRSAQAIASVRELCDVHLAGRCRITVIDVNTNVHSTVDTSPVAGCGHRLLVTPTLVRSLPLPERKVVGDLSDARRVLLALGLRSNDPALAHG